MAAFVGQTPNGACLFVKGLAKGVNEKHLALFFGSFGSLLLCQLARHRSGRSAGFAIISFGDCHDAQTALLRTDKAVFLGRQLIVRWFQPDFDGPKIDSGAFLFQTRPPVQLPPHGAPHMGTLASQRGMRNAYSDPGTASESDEQQWYGQGQHAAAPAAVPSSVPPTSWPAADPGIKLCTWREEEEQTDLLPLLPSLLLDESAKGGLTPFGGRHADASSAANSLIAPPHDVGGRNSLFCDLSSAGSLDYMLDIVQADFAALSCCYESGSGASSLLSSSAESLHGSRLLKWGAHTSTSGGGSSGSSSSHSTMRRSRSLEGCDIVVTATTAHPFSCAGDYDVLPAISPVHKVTAVNKAATSGATASGFLNLPDEFPLSLDLCFQPAPSQQQQQQGNAFTSSAGRDAPVLQETREGGGAGPLAPPPPRPTHQQQQAQGNGCYSSPGRPLPPPAGRSTLAHHAPAFVPQALQRSSAFVRFNPATPVATATQQQSSTTAASAGFDVPPMLTSKHMPTAAGGFVMPPQQAMAGAPMPTKQMQAAGFDPSMLQAMGGGAAGTTHPYLPWAMHPYAAAALQQYVVAQQNMAMAAAALGQMGGGGNWMMPDASSAFASAGAAAAWFPPAL